MKNIHTYDPRIVLWNSHNRMIPYYNLPSALHLLYVAAWKVLGWSTYGL